MVDELVFEEIFIYGRSEVNELVDKCRGICILGTIIRCVVGIKEIDIKGNITRCGNGIYKCKLG